MARARSRDLSEKTDAVRQQVARHERGESVLAALRRTEEFAAKAGSAEELRKALDVETVHLRDVIDAKAKLQETVGALIAGYDALTTALGGEIDSIKEMTLWEGVVGFFSERTAREMRERRVQSAEIDAQLQDLVAQTQAIGRLLAEHYDVLGREYASVQAMLEAQQRQLEAATQAFEAADRDLQGLDARISERRQALAELTGAQRARADQELQELVNRANELTERRNAALSNAQSFELFIENHKIALDSLMRQKAAQRILIDKLRISTENRIVHYAATLESIKTAAQQESAHAIHGIGTDVDEAASRTLASIGAASDRAIVELLERHAADVDKRRATQVEVARADAEFARRFAEVAKKFLEENYEKPS